MSNANNIPDKSYENDAICVAFEEAEQQAAAYDGDKMIGECQYNIDRTGNWVIMHTGVRPEYNGRGIAKRLVECIIEAARERGVKIIPLCSYAQRMMIGKDEYKDVSLSRPKICPIHIFFVPLHPIWVHNTQRA